MFPNPSWLEGGLLDIELVDLDGDGMRELVLSGINCFTNEKGTEVVRRKAIVFIYRIKVEQQFELVYSNSNDQLALETLADSFIVKRILAEEIVVGMTYDEVMAVLPQTKHRPYFRTHSSLRVLIPLSDGSSLSLEFAPPPALKEADRFMFGKATLKSPPVIQHPRAR
jgi:hypothetical protein